MKLQEIKQKYPQYQEIPDGELASKLHQKYYPQMEFQDFASRVGYVDPVAQDLSQIDFNDPAQKQNYLLGAAREFLQGQTLGFSDEIGSAIAASMAAGVEMAKDGANPIEVFQREYPLMVEGIRGEQSQFQEENPVASVALNVAGGFATVGGPASKVVKVPAKEAVKQGAKVGAKYGAVAGTGFADSENLLSVDTAINTALGGAGGAVFGAAIAKATPVVSGYLKQAFSRSGTKESVQLMDEAGRFTEEGVKKLESLFASGKLTPKQADDEIQKQLVAKGVLTPEQARRFNLFKQYDLPSTRANVTQSTDDWVSQQSLAKKTGAVSKTVAQQDEKLIGNVQNKIEDFKPLSSTLPEANQAVTNVITDLNKKLNVAVGAAYKEAEKQAKGQPRVLLNNYARAISNNRGTEKASGGVISHAKGVLQNKGLIKKDANIDINKRGRRTTGEQLKKLTVKEAEEVRKELNRIYDSVSPEGKRLIGRLKDAIDKDVENAVGRDIFKGARQAKITHRKIIERGRRDKFDKSTRSYLEDVIDNKISEKDVIPKLLNAADDDFVSVKRYLTKEAGDGGQQAWTEIKAEVIRDALEHAISTQGKTDGGGKVFNAGKFKTRINRLKKSKKFTELFNLDEQKFIEDIIEIGEYRIPPRNAQQGKGPSELIGEEINNTILGKISFIGNGAKKISSALSDVKAANRLLKPEKQTEKILRSTD